MYHNFCIHSPVDGHLSCFYVLAIVKSAAMNIVSYQSWFQLVSRPAFLMMYSAYKLNKQGDNIQPWRTPFLTWNQPVVPCPVLTVASWPAYRFLNRQVRWSGIPTFQNFPQFIVIHIVKGFGIVTNTLLLFQWFGRCWQFDLWFLFLF